MISILSDILDAIFRREIVPGWVDIVNMSGEKMIAKNIMMKDENIKCIGLCSSYAIIYSLPYDKNMSFLDKPRYYLIVVNEQSLEPHMDEKGTNEVLAAFRKLCLVS